MQIRHIVYLEDSDFVYKVDLDNYINRIYGSQVEECERADIVVYVDGEKYTILKDRNCIFNKYKNESRRNNKIHN